MRAHSKPIEWPHAVANDVREAIYSTTLPDHMIIRVVLTVATAGN